MDILQAKQIVIEAGKRLVETGLIARTWGNVSCRLNDREFVITPSGRSYESLTPEEIVTVKIDDLSYEGEIKPSSEKGVHAAAYRLRPEVNFVIHTHQVNASIVSVLDQDMPVDSAMHASLLGSKVPLAAYGLPGTKKLKLGVTAAIEQNPGSKAVIMAHHGAVCMGADSNEAFFVAQTLEDACRVFILKKHNSVKTIKKPICYSSVRSGETLLLSGDDGTEFETPMSKELDRRDFSTAAMHRDIYLARPELNAIVHAATPDILAAQDKCRRKLKPLLDDFAQIAGVSVKKAKKEKAAKALKGRSAVFVKGGGVLCCGVDMYDANAIRMVTEKNCQAYLAACSFGVTNYINGLESLLMRFVYVKKYSKQKDQKDQ